MKLAIIYSLLLCSSKFVNGQITIETITGSSFISKEQDRIAIISENPLTLMGENFHMKPIYLEKSHQTNGIYYFPPNEVDATKEPYGFKIQRFNYDSIFIVPVSNSAKALFDSRKEIRFYKQKYFTDNTISFEKLFFYLGQSSNHYSNGIALRIDSNRNVLLLYKDAFNDSFSGNYKGQLTEDGYRLLLKFLKEDNLKTLFWPKSEYYGQDPKKLIIYFNNQRKELSSIGDSPYITMNLVMFFMVIRKYVNVERTQEDIKLDD